MFCFLLHPNAIPPPPSPLPTDIFRKADHSKLKSVVTDWAQWISGQSAESGAHALLYTATAPELEGERVATWGRGRGEG